MRLQKGVLKDRARKLKSDIPAIFLCLKAEETPVRAKLMAALTIGYALSPIDLIPDFIPILGYLDDILILPVLITLTVKLIPSEVMTKYRKEAEGLWKDGRPKKWYYGIPIIVFWMIILWVILKLLLQF